LPELTYRLLFERPLPASVLFLADLRHAVRNALVDHEEAGSAEIVMSELASNALRYGKVPSAVRLLDNELGPRPGPNRSVLGRETAPIMKRRLIML